MRRLQTYLITSLVVVMSVLFFSRSASSQVLKIGYVNDEQIKTEYKAWQKAQDDWELEAKAWEEEALQKQQDLQEFEAEFEKQKLILSNEKKREKEASINVKRDDLDAYTRRIFGPNGEAERKQAQLLQPLLERITDAIDAVALDGNYDVIFTLQSGLGYIKPTYNITDKVLKTLEESEE